MPGLLSSSISLLPQTPEKGVCSDVFRTQHVPALSRAMERNVETWIFSTIFCVCEGFPTSGKLKCQCAGAVGMWL